MKTKTITIIMKTKTITIIIDNKGAGIKGTTIKNQEIEN